MKVESFVHRGMPAEEYHAIAGVSATRLKLLAKSPLHLHASLTSPIGQTEAMEFGSLFHTAILEPSEVLKRYAIAPKCDRRTKEGKAEYARFTEFANGKSVISNDDYRLVLAMQDSISNHDEATRLIGSAGDIETTILWRDSATALPCKMRADKILRDRPVILDLKTTTDTSPDAFARAVTKFGYAVQAAHYIEGYAQEFIAEPEFVFIVVEKAPPYAVGCYNLSDEWLAVARADRSRLMRLWRECEDKDKWLGYPGMSVLHPPRWLMRDNDDE